MKKYIARMHSKSTHERRQHAARIATVVTAVVFVGWLATLGFRLSGGTSAVAAQNTSSDDSSQLANVVSGAGYTPVNSLEIASSSDDTDGVGYTSVDGQ
jgi:hypothetical protein